MIFSPLVGDHYNAFLCDHERCQSCDVFENDAHRVSCPCSSYAFSALDRHWILSRRSSGVGDPYRVCAVCDHGYVIFQLDRAQYAL